MVGHQFYTHLNGVPAQVVKHSPSATYISHLYNCRRHRSLPTLLHLQDTFSDASVHLEMLRHVRGKEEKILSLSFLFIFQLCPFLFMAHSLNNVVIAF